MLCSRYTTEEFDELCFEFGTQDRKSLEDLSMLKQSRNRAR